MAEPAVTAPQRIQRQRVKGWRMPEGAVYVGRPSRWGNPFVIGGIHWLINDDDPADQRIFYTRSAEAAVANFRWFVTQTRHANEIRRHLKGRDLDCWCKAGSPCHADVLLEIANSEETS